MRLIDSKRIINDNEPSQVVFLYKIKKEYIVIVKEIYEGKFTEIGRTEFDNIIRAKMEFNKYVKSLSGL